MGVPIAVSMEEYLHTVYRPDCDYVDGEVIERNLGEYDHASLQDIFSRIFHEMSRMHPIRVKPGLRVRVSATRVRIPDLCVMLKSQRSERVLTAPPFICIEILSPEDRISRIIERVKDYLAFGVKHVWVIDPRSRTAYTHSSGESQEVRDFLTTANPDLSISIGLRRIGRRAEDRMS